MDLNLPIFNQNLLHRHADFNCDFSSVGDSFEKKKKTDRNMNTRVVLLFCSYPQLELKGLKTKNWWNKV